MLPEYKENNYKTLIVKGKLVHELRMSNDLGQHQIIHLKTELGSLGYYFTRNDNVTANDCEEKRLFQELFECLKRVIYIDRKINQLIVRGNRSLALLQF